MLYRLSARKVKKLENELRTIEQSLGGGATLGVAAQLVGEDVPPVLYNADTVFPTASVIKAAIVAEAYIQEAEGHLSLNEAMTVDDGACVGGSGVLAELTPGFTLPLRDFAVLAIMVSDNTASNLVLQAVGGPEVVNRRMQDVWGMKSTVIHRPIKFHLEPNDPPHTATGTPRDMCRLMQLAAEGKLHSPSVSKAVREVLRTVRDTSMLPRYLSVNAYADDLDADQPAYMVAHKTGDVTGVRNNAGIISNEKTGKQLAVCVYTKNVPDDRWTVEHRGEIAVAEVGRLLCAQLLA